MTTLLDQPETQTMHPATESTTQGELSPEQLHQLALAAVTGDMSRTDYPDLQMSRGASPGMQRYREMTLEELLLENRIVFLVGEINHVTATRVIMQLLHLSSTKKGVDINFYINSPGGSVDDTLAMIDTMNFLECDVATYCIGRAMSGGALCLAAGTKGKRYCLPHAKVMIHQPLGGIYGQASDVQIQAEEILKTKDMLNEMLAGYCDKPVEEIAADVERDKFLSALEAKEYGIVDEVIEKTPDAADS